jgi:serine/threonine-protein kinase
MTLTAGARIGPYEVRALLGAGGMGEVYRARDTRLKRDVALKILPASFAADPERLARFQREAEVLASLNHPNIGAIHGVEEGDGIRALVLEFVDGPTLADLIARRAGPSGPAGLPLDEALPIARQIADALEAAHERGIIHRDLKPANIKLRPDGAVKVLDFGLAKLTQVVGRDFSPAGSEDPAYAMTASPTMTSPAMTRLGVILGTAAYMAPEQARGRAVDKRSDIWAFGCVLYEMLTGKQVFVAGETISDAIAAILKNEPDWHVLPAETPSNIRTLLFRCLQKDVKKRVRDAGDIVLELDEPLPAPATSAAGPSRGASMFSRRSLLMGLSGLLLGALVTGLAVRLLEPPRSAPVTRFTMRLPPGQRLAGLDVTAMAFSPDGRRLAYVASAGGPQQLYLREMDSLEGMPIAGTEGATSPFFSPDGQWVGFFASNRLKKVSVSGGAPVILAPLSELGRGASWGVEGDIIFSSGLASGLSLVSSAGGTVQTLTTLDRQKGQRSYRFPHHLPGGRSVLFTVGTGGSWDDARIEVLRLDTGERRVLIEGGSDGRYVPSGHLVYLRAGTLMAVPFNLDQLEISGNAVEVVDGVLPSTNLTGAAQAAFADDGSLFYVPGTRRVSERTLVLIDRIGTEQAFPLPPRPYQFPRLSSDGQRLALDIDEGNRQDVWLYDLRRGTLTRLTFDGGMFPVWTPDGKKVTFESNKEGPTNLFWRSADGSGAEERLTTSDNPQHQGQWSPNGETLAFTEAALATGWDIWTLSLKDGRKVQAFLQTPFNETNPAFSPDGRWVAYQSDESGRDEVYVQPFPGPGSKELVSTDGGTEPAWSRDGRELFYRSGDRMLAVPTTTQPAFRASKPEVLFERPYWTVYPGRIYDVTADGRRFLMIKESEQAAAAVHINVVQNWLEELRRLVPVD